MPKVLIIEDEAGIRQGLDRLLQRAGYETVLAGGGVEGLEAARREAVDVVLTDLHMPGLSGLEVIRLLQELDPTLPVVVLTGKATVGAAVAAMRHAGAYDFLEKPVVDPSVVELAIAQAFVHGQRLKAASAASAAAPPLPPLTERERQLLDLLAQGLENERIAEITCLTPKTVRNYMSALYAKLGVKNRLQAMRLAAEAGV